MEGQRRIAYLFVLLAALSGCTSTPPPPSQPSTSPTPVPDKTALTAPTDCRARIEAADLANAATIAPLDDCRFTAAGLQAAGDVLAAGGSRDQLWAAVWVYGSSWSDPEPLRPMLAYGDPSLRAMAGAAIGRAGGRDGLEGLRQALDADGFLLGATQPIPIARFAATSLARLVNAPGTPLIILSADSNARFVADWRAWFDEHSQALAYDSAAGEWKLP